jgi:hypothetical protein
MLACGLVGYSFFLDLPYSLFASSSMENLSLTNAQIPSMANVFLSRNSQNVQILGIESKLDYMKSIKFSSFP